MLQNYRDIMDSYDRMGVQPAYAPYPATGNLPGVAIYPNELVGANSPCAVPAPSTPRIVYAGFERACIDKCGTETVKATIQAPYTVTGLFIPPRVACALSIIDFRIGRWPALGSCDPVPADLFSTNDMDEQMFGSMEQAANTEVCLTLENETNRPINFTGALKVVICEPC